LPPRTGPGGMLGFEDLDGIWRSKTDEREAAHAGADHPQAAAGGGGTGPRVDGAPGVQEDRGTEQTYYRWRTEFGGLRLDQAKRLKALETENTRLKKLVAALSLDNAILKEASSGNF